MIETLDCSGPNEEPARTLALGYRQPPLPETRCKVEVKPHRFTSWFRQMEGPTWRVHVSHPTKMCFFQEEALQLFAKESEVSLPEAMVFGGDLWHSYQNWMKLGFFTSCSPCSSPDLCVALIFQSKRGRSCGLASAWSSAAQLLSCWNHFF